MSIALPEAPAIPGLVWRRFRGAADWPDIATVINASMAADRNSERITTAGLANIYAHPVHWDPQQDTLLVTVDGLLVGYAHTEWCEEDDGACPHLIHLHLVPEWRGRGLELPMQRHMERRARVAAATGPAGARHWFASMVPETWPARAEMLLARGYAPGRYYFEMQRPLDDNLPEAVLPPGFALRPPLPEHYRAIWDAGEECFRDQRDHVAPSEERYWAWVASPDLDPTLWLVAWAGDQVAGAAINVIHEGAWGETDDLFVRRPWRQQGLGRALLVGSLHLFKARGLTTAGLGVDAENLAGALGLYESVGYCPYQRVTSWRKLM
ncbi:MAG: GNAT family N-acetyltransferase [Chloroflexi bacterium]|nr:GNAT family N-acetyltransferase [Chloroflexota bacterium]MBU1750837.1 GNAT family N-acetyltransferase [Chloroflexota bacterium]MBU1878550.1 GNAT family N-acetyltransferase [Chloroflexota bacterium]